MKNILVSIALLLASYLSAETRCLLAEEKVYPGADARTPSKSQYFSWINNTNEGATEEQTLVNLEFFRWLRDEYGMVLDIYAFDAGAIDGKFFYGSMDSERFKEQFPNGFGKIYEKAKSMDTRLGLWGGPGGFGVTEEDAQKRIDMMSSLCRDYEWALFKFDAVCGQLPKNKEPYFIKMMKECRKYSPDLILLNHRLPLGPEARAHSTTFLLGGQETYVDIHLNNSVTAPHHRQSAITRKNVRGMVRLTEDHGVCLSSSLDFWEDDLIIQAFGRSLILAPQLYGNPWLLRDDEYPKLARIFNLHRRYRDILVDGVELPKSYGPHAVSRGNSKTRWLVLRNASWQPVTYTVNLTKEIGLADHGKFEVRQFHPTENALGQFKFNDKTQVQVQPFRVSLVMISSEPCEEIAVEGSEYQVDRDVKGKAAVVRILGSGGITKEISLTTPKRNYTKATIDGNDVSGLLKGEKVQVKFNGAELTKPSHYKLGALQKKAFPRDAERLYEATCFAADNNALEARCIDRSGWSKVPAVRKAQDAFFNQQAFVGRGVWDKYMFDGDKSTSFYPSQRNKKDQTVNGGQLRLDFGEVIHPDKIVIECPDHFSLMPWLEGEGGTYVSYSTDLKNWKWVHFIHGLKSRIYIPDNEGVRYIRFNTRPFRVSEVNAYKDGKAFDRSKWRGSNLFSKYHKMKFSKYWSNKFKLSEIPKGGYLCVALNGKHGVEGAYAAMKVNGRKYVGANDRARAFQSNTWEYFNSTAGNNYTYYIPLSEEMIGQELEVVVLGRDSCSEKLKADVWVTSAKSQLESKELILE